MMRTLDSMIRGVGASALGTLAMDALLYRRYRGGGGETPFLAWEFSARVETWKTRQRGRTSPSGCSSA